MKYLRIVLLFILVCLGKDCPYAQSSAAKAISRVVYIGIENNLDYILKRYDTAIVDFSVDIGRLNYYYQYNQLVWTGCEKLADSVVITIYQKHTLEVIDTVLLSVSLLPDPSIVIPTGKHKLYWGKKELYENRVIAAFNAPKFKFKCKIMSFGLYVKSQTGMLKEYENIGEKYTDDAIGLMKQFHKGDTAYFSDFKVRCGCEQKYRVLLERLKFVRVGEIIKVEREMAE